MKFSVVVLFVATQSCGDQNAEPEERPPTTTAYAQADFEDGVISALEWNRIVSDFRSRDNDEVAFELEAAGVAALERAGRVYCDPTTELTPATEFDLMTQALAEAGLDASPAVSRVGASVLRLVSAYMCLGRVESALG